MPGALQWHWALKADVGQAPSALKELVHIMQGS